MNKQIQERLSQAESAEKKLFAENSELHLRLAQERGKIKYMSIFSYLNALFYRENV